MENFVALQKRTFQHRLALVFLPLIIIIGYLIPVVFWIGLGIFFLVTSFRLLKSMLFWMLILGVLSLVFPPLAPIIFVVMIIFFIMRIGFVIKNWRPFTYGIVFYGLMSLLVLDTYQYYDWGYSFLAEILYEPISAFDTYYTMEIVQFISGVIIAVLSTFILRAMLINCYNNGYESYVALGVMGSAPLIIISFLLPFLKIHIGDPVVSDTYMPDSKTPAPSTSTYVDPYIRTAPDGILQNNYSYTGADKIVPNPETTNVSGHLRGGGGDVLPPGEVVKSSNLHINSAEPAILPGKQRTEEKDK